MKNKREKNSRFKKGIRRKVQTVARMMLAP